MPERCIPSDKCGTHAPLWLAGPHPKRRQGIVTRRVCGHWKKRCCAFRSKPIQVKKCRGNYYVYKLAPPSSCYLAYCAGTTFVTKAKGKVPVVVSKPKPWIVLRYQHSGVREVQEEPVVREQR